MNLHQNHAMAFCCSKPKDTQVEHHEPINDDSFHTNVQRKQDTVKDYGHHSGSLRPNEVFTEDDRRQETTDPMAQLKADNGHLKEQAALMANENARLSVKLRQCEEELETLRYQQTHGGWSNQPASEHSSRRGTSHGHNMAQSRRESDMVYSRSEYQRMQSHYEENNMNLQQQLLQCREEKEELQNRLSEYVSTKISDNNPHIVNLGDRNRPEKLAERFSEMYDNQWSEAFDFLHEDARRIEKDAIQYIFRLLKLIFDACEDTARDQLDKTEKSIVKMIGTTEIPEHMAMHMKACKEERKKNFAGVLPSVIKAVNKSLKLNDYIIYVHEDCAIKAFVTEATEICWLMCIQDPPMVLDTDCQSGAKFDKKRFKHYTNTGKSIEYPVWPAVCLHKGGPVMLKGIVQGTLRKKNMFGKSVSGDKKRKDVDVYPHSSYGMEQFETDRKSQTKTRIYGKDGTAVQFPTATQTTYKTSDGTKSRRGENVSVQQGHAGSRNVQKTDIKSHSLSDTRSDNFVLSRNIESKGRPRSNMESSRRQTLLYNEQDQTTECSVLSVTSIDTNEYNGNRNSAGEPRVGRLESTKF